MERANKVVVAIVSVSPNEEDHAFLERIFNQSEWLECTNCRCNLYKARALPAALAAFENNRVPILICEEKLLHGTWKDALACISLLPAPPFLIVTSRLADESLWAEALNLGAYDVLAKPFDKTEVIRVISFAWLYWEA